MTLEEILARLDVFFWGPGTLLLVLGTGVFFLIPGCGFAVEKPGICSDLCPGTGRPEGGKTRRALSVCLPDDRPGGHHRHGEHRGGGHRADRRRTGCSGVDGADGPDGYGAEICRVSAGGALPAEKCPGRAVRRPHVCHASGRGLWAPSWGRHLRSLRYAAPSASAAWRSPTPLPGRCGPPSACPRAPVLWR